MSSVAKKPAVQRAVQDAHGERRLLRNVLTSWASQVVQILSGFVLPRLIDRNLGQATLGVWDFSWAVVSYFQFVSLGVASSINSRVASHRARGDVTGLNQAVSSVAVVLTALSAIVVGLAIACSYAVSWFPPERVGSQSEAALLILFLGTSFAVQLSSSVYAGVLTGCHRWDWHNGVYAATSGVTLVGMLAALLCGAGIVWLSLVILLTEAGARQARLLLARRACPGLAIRFRAARWEVSKEMLGFGGKNFIRDGSHLLLDQTVSVMTWTFLGPTWLAVYARPAALVRNVATLVAKYANVLIPTASSLHGAGEMARVRALAVQASRYGLFLCLPIHAAFMILGGHLIHLWMGAEYANHALVAFVALGSLFHLSNMPLSFLLTGVNMHGRIGLANVITALVTAGVVYAVLRWFHGGVVHVAVALALPRVVLNGVYLPVHACRRLGIPLRSFLKEAWTTPLALCLPFTGCLLAARLLFPESPLVALGVGSAAGCVCLGALYWRYVLPAEWRHRVRTWFAPQSARGDLPADPLPAVSPQAGGPS